MKLSTISVVSAVALTTVAISAGASNDDRGQNTRQQWLPKQQVEAQLNQMGYQVHRLKADDGCIEAYVTDRNGTRGEMYLDPTTGMPGCRGKCENRDS